jgi:5-methylcytosine-specific restriction endonuclease McrA
MKKLLTKTPRLRLDAEGYRQLHREVLARDGWRCQACGCMTHLQVHHVEFRSHSGKDVEKNLITLCADCHAISHGSASSAVR